MACDISATEGGLGQWVQTLIWTLFSTSNTFWPGVKVTTSEPPAPLVLMMISSKGATRSSGGAAVAKWPMDLCGSERMRYESSTTTKSAGIADEGNGGTRPRMLV